MDGRPNACESEKNILKIIYYACLEYVEVDMLRSSKHVSDMI